MSNMRKTRIRRLVRLYFDGRTGLKQEKALREYFLSAENADPEFEKYRAVFEYCRAEAESAGCMGRAAVPETGRRPKALWAFPASVAVAAVLSAVVLMVRGTSVTEAAGIEYTIDGIQVDDDALALEMLDSKFSRIGAVSEAMRRNGDRVSGMLGMAGGAIDDMNSKLKIK